MICLNQAAEGDLTCDWVDRPGHLRDAPNVGVRECRRCGIVMHADDVSDLVDYANSTMHQWAPGYGLESGPPKTDVEWRVNRVRELCEDLDLTGDIQLLDFGSGDGTMIQAFSEHFDAFGLEPEVRQRDECNSRGLRVFCDLTEISNQKLRFDVITLFHVVEHITEPLAVLTFIRQFLKPGGIVILETPNANDALLTRYNCTAFQDFTYWSHHPILYSQRALSAALENSGFKVLLPGFRQRYSLGNHLYWLAHGLPGGHDVYEEFISNATTDSYDQELFNAGESDTLWFVAKN